MSDIVRQFGYCCPGIGFGGFGGSFGYPFGWYGGYGTGYPFIGYGSYGWGFYGY